VTQSITPWQRFKLKWQHGCGAKECTSAQKIVLARGTIPCDVLFVGEAPGESEDSTGVPFIGGAGKLLDDIIDRSLGRFLTEAQDGRKVPLFSSAFCNMVCCIPKENGKKATEPSVDQVESCAQRLFEFIMMCDPKLIVTVGKVATDWLDPKYSYGIKLHRIIPQVEITHPAYMLRKHVAERESLAQEAVVIIASAVQELVREMSVLRTPVESRSQST
jgi:uracil-DNA glycosylase family 4